MCALQDSPEAALSFAATTAQDQFTNWYLQFQNNPPYLFDLAYNFVNNFSAAANAVRTHGSLGGALRLQTPRCTFCHHVACSATPSA